MFTVISLSGLLERSEELPNHPRGEDKLIPQGIQPSQKWEDKPNLPQQGFKISWTVCADSSAYFRKEKYVLHRKCSEREASFWIKIKLFLYHKEMRRHRIPLLQQPINAVNFWFSPGIANRCWCFPSGQFLFFQAVFLQIKQPVSFTNSFFLRMFSLFFTFSIGKLLLQFVFVLIGGISGCLWFLRTQLCTSEVLLVPRLVGIVSVSISAEVFFCSVIVPF